MTLLDDHGPLIFFKHLHRKFGNRLKDKAKGQDMITTILDEAYQTFEETVVDASNEAYTLACRGGCANCCTIRVAATAPEVLLIARTIKATHTEFSDRIFAADARSNALDEAERMSAALPCPLIEQNLCAIYNVRPLACRGHASYDEQACVDALNGLPADVPVSALHMQARSLIQNALQSAMRDAGMSWATYELNAALKIALTGDDIESHWINGKDVFASAMLTEVSLEEMSETFDAIKMAS